MTAPRRRDVLVVGGTGIASMALPSAAAAASVTILTPAAGDIKASGGTVTGYFDDGTTYVVHTFTSVGTTTFTPTQNLQVEYLVVAGGGGGAGHVGGGGGGGGVLTNLGATTLSLTSGTEYTVVVGDGGSGGSHPGGGLPGDANRVSATKGGDSQLGDLVAKGGGSGGTYDFFAPGSGGSGGGSGWTGHDGGAGTEGQGFAGGKPTVAGVTPTGGGGGAGGAGQDGTSAKAGDGGPGLASAITGTVVRYGGGGGGGVHDIGGAPAGSGRDGGGDGVTAQTTLQPQQAGTNGRGGGGGGGGYPGSDGTSFGGAGGSGVVIVRYPAT